MPALLRAHEVALAEPPAHLLARHVPLERELHVSGRGHLDASHERAVPLARFPTRQPAQHRQLDHAARALHFRLQLLSLPRRRGLSEDGARSARARGVLDLGGGAVVFGGALALARLRCGPPVHRRHEQHLRAKPHLAT
eukprot:1880009-Rhodomonas_salina.1